MKPAFCIPLLLAALAAGCTTTPSQANYKPSRTDMQPSAGAVSVVASQDITADGSMLVNAGYALIGHSDFCDVYIPDAREMQDQARRVGATYVIYSATLIGAQSSMAGTLTAYPSQTVSALYPSGRGAQALVPGTLQSGYIPINQPVYITHEGYYARTANFQAFFKTLR